MLLSPGLMLLTNYITSCWPDVKPIKFCCVASEVVKPIIMWPIYDHFKTTGHEVSLDNFSIVGRDDQSMTRTIREAMLIRVNDPSLNRNIGKYQLPHIWDEVLVRSPEMQLK